MTFYPGMSTKNDNKTKNLMFFLGFWLFFEITPVCRKNIQNQDHHGMSNFCQFFDIFIPSFTIFSIFLRYTGVISKNMSNKSGKSELFCPILVRKNGKEQSRSRMNLYIYARDLGKKREKNAIFQAIFFREKIDIRL